MSRVIQILLILMILCSPAAAQPLASLNGAASDEFTPKFKPEMTIYRLQGEIRIDGNMDDTGWANAARSREFSENYPGEGTRPPVDVEVRAVYDDEHLYLGFFVWDDPSKIRASLRDRDEIWQDDYVGILLDTGGDASHAYYIFSNPIGVQGDSRWAASGGEDDSFNIVYKSEGKITEKGYQVEMAIPFRSLRFPERSLQEWRATFWITHPRDSRRQYTWAAIDRNDPCFACQWGTLKGIENVKSGNSLELLPAVTGFQSGSLNERGNPASGFNNGAADGDVALGLKYTLNSNLAADVTFNPDFSQIEADAAQINVNTTFALFFPERRPFFQEGGDLLNTYFRTVYTRSLNNPAFAAKLTGRFNRTSIAYIGGRDDNSPFLLPFEESSRTLSTTRRSFSNIFRLRQTFGKSSYIGALITDRRFGSDGSGSLFSADGKFRFLNNYQLEWQFIGSRTRELQDSTLTASLNGRTFNDGKHTAAFDGESYNGHAYYLSFERNARVWSFDFDWWEYSPTFRADNGFVSQNNLRRATLWTGVTLYPKSKIFDRISPGMVVGRIWNFAGARKDNFFQPMLNMNLKGQTFVWMSYQTSSELFRGVQFDGLNRGMFEFNTNFNQTVRGGFFVESGRYISRSRLVRGTGSEVSVWATIKPRQNLVIQPRLNYSQLDGPDGNSLFSGYILRTRFNYQFSRELFLRLVVQYNDFSDRVDIDPLLTYKINAFTAFYIGSTLDYASLTPTGPNNGLGEQSWNLTSRQFFLKFQYLVRL